LSARELNALAEEATVDAHDADEQLAGFHMVIDNELAMPFQTVVLGVKVTVTGVDLVPGTGIVALCRRGAYTQRIGLLDLPLPSPPPTGAQWVHAYRHWA
jgi:hypothetical protein